MKKVILTLAVLALMVSCTNPFVVKATKTASVTLNIETEQSTTGARTIMPDFALSADSYKITLESNGIPPFATKTVTIDTTVSTYTFPSVETGSWNITIDALKSGAVIASGKLTEQTVASEGFTASIILNPVINLGTGDFSFKFQFPLSLGVTNVSCTLYDDAGNVVIPGTDDLNLSGSTDIIATFVNTVPLAAGSYSIITKFLSNSIDIGSFREVVNIFPGSVSDKWIQADGTLTDRRVFKTEEFGSANTDLVNFEIEGLNSSQFQFASTNTSYTIYDIPSDSFRIKATESVPGQKISFGWNTLEPVVIASGVYSRPLALKEGDNTLTVIVVASGGGTPKNYTFTLKRQAYTTSASSVAMQMVKVPAGTFQRDDNSLNTSYVSSFYMGKYEVTQAQYQAVMGANPAFNTTQINLPVDRINFYRAITFCNKLSLLEGLKPVYRVTKSGSEIDWSGIAHDSIPTMNDDDWNAAVMNVSANGYRLPTEMEWRWAAMGATKDARSGDIVNEVNVLGYTKGYAGSTEAGSNIANRVSYVWSSANSSNSMQLVGTKLPNELGIYDMSGNVWEWCWDLYASYPTGSVSNYLGATSPVRSSNATSMFVGAGYADSTFLLNDRGAIYRKPQDGPNTVGFRVARGALPSRIGLVGEWLFDKLADDTSGQNLHGTLGAVSKTLGHNYLPSSAYNLPNNSIQIPAASSTPLAFTQSDSFTLSTWFKATDVAASGIQWIFCKYSGVSNEFCYYLSIESSLVKASISKMGTTPVSVSKAISSGQWYHAVMVYNGTIFSLYVNGEYVASGSLNQTCIGGANGIVYFGGGDGTTFNGNIDDFRIYNRVLSIAEIKALYAE